MLRFRSRIERKLDALLERKDPMPAIDDLNAAIDRVSNDVADILAVLKNPASDDAAIEAAVTRLGGVADALEAAKAPATPAAQPSA